MRVYVYMYLRVCGCRCVYLHVYVFMCMCMFMHVYVCVCIWDVYYKYFSVAWTANYPVMKANAILTIVVVNICYYLLQDTPDTLV